LVKVECVFVPIGDCGRGPGGIGILLVGQEKTILDQQINDPILDTALTCDPGCLLPLRRTGLFENPDVILVQDVFKLAGADTGQQLLLLGERNFAALEAGNIDGPAPRQGDVNPWRAPDRVIWNVAYSLAAVVLENLVGKYLVGEYLVVKDLVVENLVRENLVGKNDVTEDLGIALVTRCIQCVHHFLRVRLAGYLAPALRRGVLEPMGSIGGMGIALG
jgi:hypothetical protein